MQRRLQFDRKSAASSQKNINNHTQISETLNDQTDENDGKFLSVNSSTNNINLLSTFRLTKKQLSVSPRRTDLTPQDNSSERADSIGPSNGSTKREESVSRYECIAALTQQQNTNLKQQNKYLLEKLRKMQDRQLKVRKLYEKAKRYKGLWEEAKVEIEVLKDQCQIYKDQAEQMKKIILNDVCNLKKKVMETEIHGEGSESEAQFKSGSKKQRINSNASTQNKSVRVSSSSSLTKYIARYPETV